MLQRESRHTHTARRTKSHGKWATEYRKQKQIGKEKPESWQSPYFLFHLCVFSFGFFFEVHLNALATFRWCCRTHAIYYDEKPTFGIFNIEFFVCMRHIWAVAFSSSSRQATTYRISHTRAQTQRLHAACTLHSTERSWCARAVQCTK